MKAAVRGVSPKTLACVPEQNSSEERIGGSTPLLKCDRGGKRERAELNLGRPPLLVRGASVRIDPEHVRGKQGSIFCLTARRARSRSVWSR